jgi:phosphoribosylformylglycinamidine synthase
VLRVLIAEGLVEVARPVSRGGLLLALARGCFGGVGFSGAVGEGSAASLFGEDHGRAVIALRPEAREAVERAAAEAGVPCAWLGRTGGAQIALSWPGGGLGASVAGLQAIWSGALPRRLEPRAV